jgi:methylated-DNA-[protein]-cysteine S-methyltransferase
MILSYKFVNSPVGKLKLVASDRAVIAVLWENDNPRRVRLDHLVEDCDHAILVRTEVELKEYFAGKRNGFSIPLDLRGTSFQKRVWEALLGIPFGETRTYGQLAAQVRNPRATRAVGAANGRNPISIIVPCHRVIGSSGKLTGFAGGLDAKTHLLQLEERGARSTERIRVRSITRQSILTRSSGCIWRKTESDLPHRSVHLEDMNMENTQRELEAVQIASVNNKTPGFDWFGIEFRPDLAFPHLTEEMAERLKVYGSEETVPANTALYAQGDREIDMFVVLEGGVDVFLPDLNGGSKIYGQHRKLILSEKSS